MSSYPLFVSCPRTSYFTALVPCRTLSSYPVVWYPVLVTTFVFTPMSDRAFPTEDMIKGALAVYGLSLDGTRDEMHRRLGDHLVVLKFKKKRSSNSESSTPVKKTRQDWFTYLRTERIKVMAETGLKDRADVMKEVARRWKEAKKTGAPSPLLLTFSGVTHDQAPSEDEGRFELDAVSPTTSGSPSSSASSSIEPETRSVPSTTSIPTYEEEKADLIVLLEEHDNWELTAFLEQRGMTETTSFQVDDANRKMVIESLVECMIAEKSL